MLSIVVLSLALFPFVINAAGCDKKYVAYSEGIVKDHCEDLLNMAHPEKFISCLLEEGYDFMKSLKDCADFYGTPDLANVAVAMATGCKNPDKDDAIDKVCCSVTSELEGTDHTLEDLADVTKKCVEAANAR